MLYVVVVFTNGNVVTFAAKQFDADLKSGLDYVNKYPYKDAEGNDSAIHLRPNDVAGLFVTPGLELERDEPAISTKVPSYLPRLPEASLHPGPSGLRGWLLRALGAGPGKRSPVC